MSKILHFDQGLKSKLENWLLQTPKIKQARIVGYSVNTILPDRVDTFRQKLPYYPPKQLKTQPIIQFKLLGILQSKPFFAQKGPEKPFFDFDHRLFIID